MPAISNPRRTTAADLCLSALVVASLASRAAGQPQFDELRKRGLPADADQSRATCLCDVDGDGDLDIVMGSGGYPWQHPGRNRLYRNDGNGVYTDVSASRLPNDSGVTFAVASGDVDGDGDVDLVLGNDGQNRLYRNDGSGSFADVTATHMPADDDTTAAVALGDVDGDGDLDLLLVNRGSWPERTRLYVNNGAGVFVDATTTQLPIDYGRSLAVVLGDVDGDGDLNAVFGGTQDFYLGNSPNRLYRNDGSGSFVDASTSLPPHSCNTPGIALGDVDADGDLDMVLANRSNYDGYQNGLLLNDGSGRYIDVTATAVPPALDESTAVAMGDVDGDGDLDLVFGNAGQQNRLSLNDGAGTFSDVSATRLPADVDFTSAVIFDDVDGDGDVDLIVGNRGQTRLYQNDGTGAYADVTATHLPAMVGETAAVAVGDVDGDGDSDLVLANAAHAPNVGEQDRLYSNTGGGVFVDVTTSHLPVDSDDTLSAAFSDVDGDGDLDLVFGGALRLYVNAGDGTFTDTTGARMPAWIQLSFAAAVAFGDVDQDGDPDLAIGGGLQDRLLFNLQRQWRAPWLLRVGRPYRLEGIVRQDPPALLTVGLPFLATETATTVVPPFGVLRLDPTRAVPLRPFLISPQTGVGSVTIRTPNVPGLVGIEVYTQALLLPSSLPARLSDLTADVLLR